MEITISFESVAQHTYLLALKNPKQASNACFSTYLCILSLLDIAARFGNKTQKEKLK